MAGGDGSQAIVAAIAAERGLPYACVPAGTRNHFALDLGVDRDDVVGALDAFVDGGERIGGPGRGQRARVRQQRLARALRRGRPARGLSRREDAHAARHRAGHARPRRQRARPALDQRRAGTCTTRVRWCSSPTTATGSAAPSARARGRGSTTACSGSRWSPSPRGAARAAGSLQRPLREWSAPDFEVDADSPVARRHRRRGAGARPAAALSHPARRPARADRAHSTRAPRPRPWHPKACGRAWSSWRESPLAAAQRDGRRLSQRARLVCACARAANAGRGGAGAGDAVAVPALVPALRSRGGSDGGRGGGALVPGDGRARRVAGRLRALRDVPSARGIRVARDVAAARDRARLHAGGADRGDGGADGDGRGGGRPGALCRRSRRRWRWRWAPMLFLAGSCRLGFVADFFGKPVLLGYINGVALIVIASQLGKLFGISVGARDFFAIIGEIIPKLGDANGPTVILSAGLLAAALAVKRFLPAVPPSLVVLALALVVAALADLGSSRDRGRRRGRRRPAALRVAERRSAGLPRSRASGGRILARRLRRPDRDRAHIRHKHGYEIDANRELTALGAANLIGGLTSAFPGLLLQLSLRCQRLEPARNRRARSLSPRRSSGSFSSSRCR